MVLLQRRLCGWCVVLMVVVVAGAEGVFYYLPGVSPASFKSRQMVPMTVGKVTSTKTQIPYEYESLSRFYCTDEEYVFEMKVPDACKFLCLKRATRPDLRLLRAMIDNEYRHAFSLDGLPARLAGQDYVTRGFPVGFALDGRHYVYNHLRFTVSHNERHIVGLEVEPFSVWHRYDEEGGGTVDASTPLDTCNEMRPALNDPSNYQQVDGSTDILYTYDVNWVYDESVTWSRRWDIYLRASPDDEIHYFAIVNSLMIVLFLTGVVAMIMLRTLRKDISQYNGGVVADAAGMEDAAEESGWKLLHGDVFRPPPCPAFLAVCVGTGSQLLVMTFAVMCLALLGFLSPGQQQQSSATRGFLFSLFVLFVLTGGVAGYVSTRLYKAYFLATDDWKAVALANAAWYPSVVSITFFCLEALLRARGGGGSSAEATFPITTVFTILCTILFVSAPLVFLGGYLAAAESPTPTPTRILPTPREIPRQVWYTHPVFAIAFGGILPFGAVCIELFFVMSALWLEQIYYVFGFLVVVLFILVATCAEMTIVMTYFQLCNEDYRWWWRSFLSSASAAFYLFLYSVWYFNAKLDIVGLVPTVLYFGYMALVSLTFFLLCGSIGFAAAAAFVFKIYAAIKID